jgi:hypothetical protein
MPRGIPFLFALAFLAAGCFGSGGDGGGGSISAANGESLVLSKSDVGTEFTEFDQGDQRLSDFSPPRDDPNRFGRKGGWKARFSRQGKPTTDGPLVISSLADLFGSAGSARSDFELYGQSLDQFVATGGSEMSAPGLGDESKAVTFKQGLGPSAVRYYVIAWRSGNVTASINANGFKLTWEQALSLARKQEDRIRAAQ